MTTDELIRHLKSLKSELKNKFGIEQIALFGSYARGEANDESDVDIAVISIKEKLHKNVDMGYFDSIRPFVKKRIKDDLIYV